MVGLWLCYFLLATLRGTVVGLDLQGDMLWRRAVVMVVGIAVTFIMWLVIRLFDRRSLLVKIIVSLVVAVPASMLIAQANDMVFAPIEDQVTKEIGERQGVNIRRDEAGNLLLDIPSTPTGLETPGAVSTPAATLVLAPAPKGIDRWRQFTDVALGRYFLLIAWAALYLALLAGAQTRAAERREERFRSAAKAAELRSLRYQVNPHFLFNTLNSLSALVMTGKADRAEEMIQTISRFYRHSLADDPTTDVMLEDEIALQEHYLAIEAVRFPERLRTKIDLPPELAGYRVPGMILQPLVENSVKYGVSASARPVTITISAREEFGRLVLTVSDDGPGVASEAKQANGTSGFGIGLANVRDRLTARFGDAAAVSTGVTGAGYATELRLPLVKHG